MGRAFIDLTGQRFTNWTVLHKESGVERNETRWVCRCDCGTVKSVNSVYLRRGTSKSCGCNRSENVSGFGELRDPTYSSWASMKTRCNNPNSTDFHRYGGAGITFDPRWVIYDNFLADMGPRPTADHTLDRRDNRLGYSKENCRWATRLEQCSNREVTVRLNFRGRDLTLTELETETGVHRDTLRYRMDILKMSVEEAVDKKSRYSTTRLGTPARKPAP